MQTKLKLFIGSSTEALDYANAIQENLERDADCTVFTQGVFGLSRTTFTELLKKLNSFDCAVFVFAPDDRVVLRGERMLAVRDNVLFELGLFCGRFGEGRAFVVAPHDVKDLRVPTDLLGVTPATYQRKRPDGNIQAALGPACTKIRRELKALSAAGSKNLPTIGNGSFFSHFTNVFPSLLKKSTTIVLYFVHSRRWRENHNDDIVEFLKKTGVRLTVFLPDKSNAALIKALQEHFEDGPAIPGLIEDAYMYFKKLRKRFPKKVVIRRFNTYPTYSIYKFDDEFVIAAYPTTPRRRDVPAFHLSTGNPYTQFVADDLAELSKRRKHQRK